MIIVYTHVFKCPASTRLSCPVSAEDIFADDCGPDGLHALVSSRSYAKSLAAMDSALTKHFIRIASSLSHVQSLLESESRDNVNMLTNASRLAESGSAAMVLYWDTSIRKSGAYAAATERRAPIDCHATSQACLANDAATIRAAHAARALLESACAPLTVIKFNRMLSVMALTSTSPGPNFVVSRFVHPFFPSFTAEAVIMSRYTGDAHSVSKNSRNNAVCTELPSPSDAICIAASVVASGANGPARPAELFDLLLAATEGAEVPVAAFFIPGIVNIIAKNAANPQFKFRACSSSANDGVDRSPRVFTSFDNVSTTCRSGASSNSIETLSLGDCARSNARARKITPRKNHDMDNASSYGT